MTASRAISNGTAPASGPGGSADSSSTTGEAFGLGGGGAPLDARFHAFRRDLADIALAGRVIAPHYARPVERACGSRPAPVREAPDEDSPAASELLPGERFCVLEYAGGWAWGYCGADHVVGYVEAIALTELAEPTHIVCEKCAPVAPDDRITSPVLASLPMGALLHGEEQGACLTTEYGCVSLSHLRRIADPDGDPVIAAERLMGAPWRAGGRTAQGIDAGGLVQLALGLCGIAAPRTPDRQRALGEGVAPGARSRRGDLVFADAMAGLMIDDLLMIHASAAAGRVTVEPLSLYAGPDLERRRLPL